MIERLKLFFGCIFYTDHYQNHTLDRRMDVLRRVKLTNIDKHGMRKTNGNRATSTLILPDEIRSLIADHELAEILELHDIVTINNKVEDPHHWIVYAPKHLTLTIDMEQEAIKELRTFHNFRLRSFRTFKQTPHRFVNPLTAKFR